MLHKHTIHNRCSRRTQQSEWSNEGTVEMTSMPIAGTNARRDYHEAPNTHTMQRWFDA